VSGKSPAPMREAPPPCRLIREGNNAVPAYALSDIDTRMSIEKELKAAGVIKKGNFKLRSGKISNFYIDKDRIYGNNVLLRKIIEGMSLEIIFNVGSNRFDVIVVPETGGIVLASPLAYKIWKEICICEKTRRRYNDI